jgi:hypothetical protein
MFSLTLRALVSTPRSASLRGANSEIIEPSKKGTRRVKSPKSKSPGPPTSASVSLSALENEDARDAVVQLKGHEAEVCEHAALKPAANHKSIRSSFVLGTLLTTIY